MKTFIKSMLLLGMAFGSNVSLAGNGTIGSFSNPKAWGCARAKVATTEVVEDIKKASTANESERLMQLQAKYFRVRNYQLSCFCADEKGWAQIRQGLMEPRQDLPRNCRP